MDERSQKYFDELLEKPLGELSKNEITFLRARRSYLNPSQEKVYADLLDAEEVEEEVADAPEEGEADQEPPKEEEPPVYVAKKDRPKEE